MQTIPLRKLPPPDQNQVHLWHLNLRVLGGSLQHALSGENAGDSKSELSVTQLRFSRRFYLRLLLGAYLDIPGKDVLINRDNRGKPVLDAGVHSHRSRRREQGSETPSLHFSMAKSEDQLLIGVTSSSPLGVDLEPAARTAQNALRLAQRYFSPAEFIALKSLPPDRMDEAFLRAWACNEAVVKASGLGIANQLCRFTLQMDPDLPPAVLDIEDDQAEHWSLALVKPKADFIGAVAIRQPELEILPFQLRPAR